MPIKLNNVAFNDGGTAKYNNTALGAIKYGNTQVWRKANQLWPGKTWSLYGDGGPYISGNTIYVVTNNGSYAHAGIEVDLTGWNTLSLTFSAKTTYGYNYLGVFSKPDPSWGTNFVRGYGTGAVGSEGSSFSGTKIYSVADLNGRYYIYGYAYKGSVNESYVYITNVTLT